MEVVAVQNPDEKLEIQAAKRPDVGLERVLLGGADFGGHVKRGAHVSRSEIVGLHHLGEAEITKLYRVVLAEEDCDGC
jgi:riboflavin synthase alpha subunit